MNLQLADGTRRTHGKKFMNVLRLGRCPTNPCLVRRFRNELARGASFLVAVCAFAAVSFLRHVGG